MQIPENVFTIGVLGFWGIVAIFLKDARFGRFETTSSAAQGRTATTLEAHVDGVLFVIELVSHERNN